MKRTRTFTTIAGALLLAALPATMSAQVFAGKTNTFEDGTTQGWLINLLGFGNPPAATLPANIPTGGPAGVDDSYLQLTSLGTSTSGGRLTAINTDWGGNWLASGITHVRFNAINFGNTDVTLRLLVEDATAGPPTNVAASSGLVLNAGSGWQSLEIDLFGPSGLTALLGTVDDALTNATIIRLYHSNALAFPGEPIAAQIGLDNIRAVGAAVPEPSPAWLLAVGAIGLAYRRRRWRH